MKNENKAQSGRVNFVWALAGGYLIYLGGELLYGLYAEGMDTSAPWIVIPAAVGFIAVGILLLRREWRAYKYAAAHKDDPATWNDELAQEASKVDLPEEVEHEEDTP